MTGATGGVGNVYPYGHQSSTQVYIGFLLLNL